MQIFAILGSMVIYGLSSALVLIVYFEMKKTRSELKKLYILKKINLKKIVLGFFVDFTVFLPISLLALHDGFQNFDKGLYFRFPMYGHALFALGLAMMAFFLFLLYRCFFFLKFYLEKD